MSESNECQKVRYENEDWFPLVDHDSRSVEGSGRGIFVRDNEQKTFTKIARAYRTNFHLRYLVRQIRGLQNTGFLGRLINKFRSADRVFELEGARLVYSVGDKSNIFLKDILVDGPFRTRGKDKLADDGGMYKVTFKEGKWLADTETGQRGSIDNVNTAINGACENISAAAEFIPAFIREGYGETALRSAYNLFYVPTRGMGAEWRGFCDHSNFGTGSQIAQKLADTLQHTAESGQATRWTVHEHGHTVFTKALRILKARKVDLSNQTVFFANAQVNVSSLIRLCKKTNMQLAETAPLLNPVNFRQTFFSGNVFWFSIDQMLDWLLICFWVTWLLPLPALFFFACSLLSSYIAPNANQRVIRTADQAISHLRGILQDGPNVA